MMNKDRQVTHIQVAAVLVSSLIGVSVLALPRVVAEKVNYGAPLATLAGIGLSTVGLWALMRLGLKFPSDSVVDYSVKLLGKPIGRLLGLLFIVFFIWIAALSLREFANMMNSLVLRETPNYMIMLSVAIVIAVSCMHDIITFAYIQFFYAPLLILTMLTLVLISIPRMEFVNIFPIWGNHTDFGDFVTAGITAASMPFSQIGMFVISILIPFMKQPNKAAKGMWLGLGCSTLLILLMVTSTVAVMSAEEVVNDVWPAMALTRMTQLPAQILERIDLLYLMVWVGTALTTMLSGYMIVVFLASRLLNKKSHRGMVFSLLPIYMTIAILPRNTLSTFEWIQHIGTWGLCLTIGVPLILYMIAVIKGRRGTDRA